MAAQKAVATTAAVAPARRVAAAPGRRVASAKKVISTATPAPLPREIPYYMAASSSYRIYPERTVYGLPFLISKVSLGLVEILLREQEVDCLSSSLVSGK